MAIEIGIPFARVWFLCGGASGMASGVWVHSARVGPRFCGARSIANISGCYLISLVPPDFSKTLFVLLQVLQSPSSFRISDKQKHHMNGKTWYMTDGIGIDNGWAWHLHIYDE